MLEVMLAAVGLLALLTAASSRWLLWTPVSPPLLALLLGVGLGPHGMGLIDLGAEEPHRVVEVASQLLLAIGLMAVALRHPLNRIRPTTRPIVLLLALVMPIMAAAVALAAGLTLGVSFGTAAVIGACLAPTDPVLASGVAAGAPAERDVPERLREVLSLESGANDGLALPLALGAGALVLGGSPWIAASVGVLQVVLGIVVGAALGALAGWLLRFAERHGDIEDSARLLFTVVLAFAVLGAVELLRGNGLIGVLAAGLTYNGIVTGQDRAAEADIDEGMNQFLVLPTFALFGAVLPWAGWFQLGWNAAAFVAAVLVLRRLPWVVALHRPLGLRLPEAIWLGWFGPIGVAAIFYLAHLHTLGVIEPVIWQAGSLAVASSTLVHAWTAPTGRWLLRARSVAAGRT